MDLAPTFIAVAGGKYPDDGSVQPMLGESMLALLDGSSGQVHADDYVTAQFLSGKAYLRQGWWKITALEEPFDETGFALYDLQADPGEITDVSEQHQEKRKEMIELWRQQRKELDIILPQDL
jgi:arylsulfatase